MATGASTEPPPRETRRRAPTWLLAGGALAIVVAALLTLALVGGDTLPERTGPPVEELAVERTQLRPGTIELTVRNVGPDAVSVAQAFVNDAYVDVRSGAASVGRLARTTLVLDYPWQEGQPYLVSLLTSTGAVIEHEIPVAVETPAADGDFFALMVLLGTYVGVIPIVLGMLFLPALQRASGRWIRALLALTVGLLAFLALDGTLEGLDLAAGSSGAFGGAELVFLGIALAYLALAALDSWLGARVARATGAHAGESGGALDGATAPSPTRLALMIAIGIGLHNLGEGLAIGSAYAVGELALGAFLVVGFALHNTTEGIAIVAPLANQPARPLRLLGLGLVAGAPAIVGALIGASVDNAELSAFLLGVGVGAIVRVIVQIAPSLRDRAGRLLDPTTVGGIAAGALALYLTGLLVSV
ncbi:ZIP family metal transporter [Conexibacter woesei]|uniref:Putative metal cation transporter n=1 Tax=Conexibacter woesei (strain DSM 14684 / CCUG 47730 / CIP 108061 / JCM 11494 / NBRC 100937 / ID131577) TaxID=469383 RepID=D3F8N0_CONWI|nr:metal transporter [Conexibacter woesei]ADB50994.1 putative metal cation transporter [Conexibacter woesei DSM 14684]